jgi:hypothetical protein
VLTHICFEAAPAGRPLLSACDWLRDQQDRNKPDNNAPREVIDKAWQRYIVQKDGRVTRFDSAGCRDASRTLGKCLCLHRRARAHRRRCAGLVQQNPHEIMFPKNLHFLELRWYGPSERYANERNLV